MSQPPLGGGGGGQRSGTPQPFYFPTLMSLQQQQQQQAQQPVVITCSGNGVAPITTRPNLMSSLQQQQQQQPQHSVVITSSGNGTTPIITSSSFNQPGGPPTEVSAGSVIQQPPPVTVANLYLCCTSSNATDVTAEDDSGDATKPSIEILEESYKQLNARKIKDSLSSFLPDIPGEFDTMDSSETKLQHLLEQRMIGNKEFHPLSGHALLGFRLLPGPLPEQYRIDPPLQEARSHHRKKKHKHRSIEKVGDEGSDLNPPSSKVKMPTDAYGFIKSESPLLSTPSPSTHGYTATGERTPMQKIVASGGHVYSSTLSANSSVVASNLMVSQDPLNPFPGGKKKKEKKRNKEKKPKKEKKKKKDKHHGQDPAVGPPGAPQPTSHQHTHSHNIL